ncbi:hypothetical protein ACFLTX_02515 [Chloroflexota bacterium]
MKWIDPLVGSSTPARTRSRVLFPLPDGPKIQMNWLWQTEKDTSCRARRPPSSPGKVASSWLTTRTGSSLSVGMVVVSLGLIIFIKAGIRC